MTRLIRWMLLPGIVLSLPVKVWAEDEPVSAALVEQTAYFNDYIQPIFQKHCYDCHSHETGEASGGLVLDSKAGWEVGGDTGPAIVPGEPDKSVLMKAVSYSIETLEMPPDGKLSEEELRTLRDWIQNGAFDPRDGGQVSEKKKMDVEAGKQFWSFRPLDERVRADRLQAQRPQSHPWSTQVIDGFIYDRLVAHDLQPVEDAEPEALLRRLYYDLTGLPPKREAVDDFVTAWQALIRNKSLDPSAQEALLAPIVDQLLASSAFGEKWGRHWLDVARYADSNGSSFNPPFHEAWRYRDWVIGAFNEDLPVDQFLIKQLAGDLLEAGSQEERDENLTATGFLMFGSKVLGEFDKEQLVLDVVDEQLDTIGKAMLGMTLGCARCHDHKFDPIPHTDYYAMAGILTSTVTLQDRFGGPKEDESDWSRRGLGPGGDEALQAFLQENRYAWIKASQKQHGARKKIGTLTERIKEADGKQREKLEQELAKTHEELAKQTQTLTELEARIPAYVMAVQDAANPDDEYLRIRGVPGSKGEKIPRGFLQVASYDGQPTIAPAASGRLEMARWIASPANPLALRVYVNRVWKHLFREGLVRSIENFGTTGEQPSHPELLDYLAWRLVDLDWKLKPLIREMVLSRAYRLSTHFDAQRLEMIDAENRLLSHQNRRRLEPEEIRDTQLWIIGRLHPQPPNQSLIAHLPMGDVSNLEDELVFDQPYRSVYMPIIRNLEPEIFQVFDAANSSMTTGARPRTIVAPQALYFINSDDVQVHAQILADQILHEYEASSTAEIIQEAFIRITSRQPTQPEFAVLSEYLERQYEGPPGPTRHDVMKLCQAILGSTQFQFLD